MKSEEEEWQEEVVGDFIADPNPLPHPALPQLGPGGITLSPRATINAQQRLIFRSDSI